MTLNIGLNDVVLEATNVKSESKEPRKISFSFTVTSEEYHDVTSLLYENDFQVTIPAKEIAFHATITNYSTSITNLYHEGEEGEFYLELTEKTDDKNSDT